MNILSTLLIYLTGTFYIATVSILAVFHVINEQNINAQLRASGAYANLVPAVLQTAKSTSTGAQALVPVDQPWVRDAAATAFPASDLEQKGSVVLDSTFAWLRGEKAEPSFTLDFSENKQRLAAEVSGYTQNRLSNLPRCSVDQIPQSVDPFNLNCLPFGINPSIAADRIRDEIANDQNFLPNPVVTHKDLFGANSPSLDNAGLGYVQRLFGLQDLLVWLLPLLTIAVGVAGIFFARNTVKALRALAFSLFSAAAGLLLIGVLLGRGLSTAVESVSKDPLSQTVIGPAFSALGSGFMQFYLISAVIAVLIGVGLLFTGKRLQRS
jgi:hypothetical protein